jgi:DNA-binding transcriptional LysR family regulator
LTQLGETYYQQCKKSLEGLHDAELALSESKNEATGILHVMANRYFAIKYIFPKLSAFMAENPRLRLRFQLAERFPNLEKENIDILFGVSIEGSADLVRRRVTTTRYVLCASPDYLKAYGKPMVPADLLKHQYITHSIRKPDDVIAFKNDEEIRVTPILWLNDSFAMRECVIRGMGIANLHEHIVDSALKEGKLLEVLREYQEPKRYVYLYYQQSRYVQPKIRRFIDFFAG